jgi:hypothetical protein
MLFRLSLLGCIVLVVGLTGCSSEPEKVVVHPVSGRILYGGSPAVGVQVYLLPTSAPMVPQIPQNPRGKTGPDGSFTLTTYTEGDGAAEGGYQVILLWPAENKDDEEDMTDRLLGWYDAVHSQLTVNIKAGNNVLPTFKLPIVTRPPEASQGVPGRN